MKRLGSKPSLTMLPLDMLMVILTKVAAFSPADLGPCMLACKELYDMSKYPEVLRSLCTKFICPPPYQAVSRDMKLLEMCAEYGNFHAKFLCGLFDFFYLKNVSKRLKLLSSAANETHPEAMYVYRMILLKKGDLDEGSNFLTQLWKNQGIDVVRQCHINYWKVVLEISVREYRDLDILLGLMIVGDNCEEQDIDEVCDDCFIRKEIYCFMNYFN